MCSRSELAGFAGESLFLLLADGIGFHAIKGLKSGRDERQGSFLLSMSISHHKRDFYEQVTTVKVCFSLFPHRAFAVVVYSFVALHRVSIRTLDELSWCKLGAGWGSRGESMLLFIGRS